MRDPYSVLGVGRQATHDEIKKAFRKLAKKHHPDANKNDPQAAVRFAELNAAYEIVGDGAKRKQFDRGEIDADGKPRFHGFEGFRTGPGGSGGRGPRPDMGGESTFESFTFGPEGFRRTTGTRPGTGGPAMEDLFGDILGAFGQRGADGRFQEGFGEATGRGEDATGTVTISLAEAAKGAKRRLRLPTGRDVEVTIPPGIAGGQTIRLKGQGFASGFGGPAGDALIIVEIAPHPSLTVDGRDLRTEVAVPLADAVLGGKVRVETLDGAVELAIPPMTSGGKTFRLKGRGLPKDGGTGDLYASVRIVLPEAPDPALDALMRKWRGT